MKLWSWRLQGIRSTNCSPALILLLIPLLLSLYVLPSAYAVADDQEVDMTSLPQMLSEALGLPDTADYFAGKLLTTAIMLSLFMVPTLFACNKFRREPLLPSIFVGMLVFGFCIAMGWLDYWFLLIIALVVALMFAGKMRDLISGGGR